MSVEETNRFENEREAKRKPHSAVVAAKMNVPTGQTRAEQFDRSANLDDNSFSAPVESAGSKRHRQITPKKKRRSRRIVKRTRHIKGSDSCRRLRAARACRHSKFHLSANGSQD
jgi:hypothetical protein